MKNFSKLLVLAFTAIGLTSCLNDENVEDQKYGMINLEANKIIELPSATSSIALPLKNETTTVNFVKVNLAANEVAKEDITVTLDTTNSYKRIKEYNTDNGTSFSNLPANLRSLPEGLKVTIPAGSRTGTLKLTTNTSNFDPAKTYAVSYNIGSVDKEGYIISGNFKNSLVSVSAKNRYDGNYTVTATAPMVDVVSSALTGFYPLDSDLVTTGGNTVKMFCYTYLGGYEGHPIKNGAASSYYGNFAPIFTMDDAGNVTAVTNFYGQGTNSSSRAARLNPAGVNKWTISGNTKVMEVSYIMVQGGVDRTFFHEKWTFKKDR